MVAFTVHEYLADRLKVNPPNRPIQSDERNIPQKKMKSIYMNSLKQRNEINRIQYFIYLRTAVE